MSLVIDVSADQPPTTGRLAVQELTRDVVASLAEELVAYHQHFAPLFYRREQRDWAAVYLRGLLTADVPRKNVEAMALRLLGVGPYAEREVRALQQFIGEGAWDDDALLAEHQRLVNETLSEEDGVLIVDGSDFPKHGQHSAGVAPQWCGHTGKKDNCQAGVFLGYASRKGATLLDRRLYLPESWFGEDHRTLWQDCRIPEGICFQTKHELAAQLVEGVMQAGQLRARWVVCDEGYGDSPAFLVSGRGAARYQGLAIGGNRWANGSPTSEQLGAAPDALAQRTCPPTGAAASLEPGQSDGGGAGSAVALFRLAALSAARGAQRPAGRRFPRAARRAAS